MEYETTCPRDYNVFDPPVLPQDCYLRGNAYWQGISCGRAAKQIEMKVRQLN